jgi:hypothetical protein
MEVKPGEVIHGQQHEAAGADEAQGQYATLSNLANLISGGSAPQHGLDLASMQQATVHAMGHTEDGEECEVSARCLEVLCIQKMNI